MRQASRTSCEARAHLWDSLRHVCHDGRNVKLCRITQQAEGQGQEAADCGLHTCTGTGGDDIVVMRRFQRATAAAATTAAATTAGIAVAAASTAVHADANAAAVLLSLLLQLPRYKHSVAVVTVESACIPAQVLQLEQHEHTYDVESAQ